MDNVSNRSELPLQLYLEDDSGWPRVCLCVLFLVYIGLGVQVPLVILGIAYCICKRCTNCHTARCSYCAEPTPRRRGCKKIKFRWAAKYCSGIERITLWLLVDIFRTPHLKKEFKGGKRCLRVRKEFILELEKKEVTSSFLFFMITELFCNYMLKFLLDWFVKVSQTCIDKGDFGPASCYTVHSAGQYHKINCTAWNENSEQMVEKSGDLLCFSVYYNLLSTLAELAGLIGLQTAMTQLLIAIGVRPCGKRNCCGKRLFNFIVLMLANLIIQGPLYIHIILFHSPQLSFGVYHKQFPAVFVVILCSTLICTILYRLTPDKLTPSLESQGHLTEGSHLKKTSTQPLNYKTFDHRRKHSTRRNMVKSYPGELYVPLCAREQDECTNGKETTI